MCIIRFIFITFLTLVTALPLRSSAQPDIAAIKSQLETARTDSQKYLAYQQLFKYYEFTKSDSAIFYLDEGYRAFTASGFQKGRAACLSEMADVFSGRSLFQVARSKQEEALAIFTELKDPDGIANAHNGLGVLEGRTGHYDSAVSHFLTALRLFEQVKNQRGIVTTYVKLGTANDFAGNADKALDYFKKALETAKGMPLSGNTIIIYNNIGVVYSRRHQYKEAAAYFQQALDLTKEPKYEGLRIEPLGNLGNLYRETGEEARAQGYLEESLEISRREQLPEEECRALLNIALLMQHKTPDRALALMGEAMTISRRIGNAPLRAEVMDAMIEIYRHKGDYFRALTLQDTIRAIDDSLVTVDKAKQIANMQALYDLEKSNSKIKELKLAEVQHEQQRRGFMLTAVSSLAALLILVLYVWRTRLLNKQLRRRETELERANYVKDRLFSVIGHDLRGPIGSMPVLVGFIKDKDTSAEELAFVTESLEVNTAAAIETLDNLLNWGKAQIRGVSINPSLFKVKEVIENELSLQHSLAAGKQISIADNTGAAQAYADKDHFRIVVRNLLSNAIKFTETGGAISVNAAPGEPGYTIFSVQDNGVGMTETQKQEVFDVRHTSTTGTANEAGNSIGLMLCKTFVEENGGRIWVESEKGKGATFYFSLKSQTPNP